jgi:predicted aconitase with swiveling domain
MSIILHEGEAQGEVLELTQPLSFWGAFDPRTGTIIDIHHPQCGLSLTGKILLMRESRGSGTAPGAMAEALRLHTAPAALLLGKAEMNLAIGAAVAQTLYGTNCPMLALSDDEYAMAAAANFLHVHEDGSLTVLAPPNP